MRMIGDSAGLSVPAYAGVIPVLPIFIIKVNECSRVCGGDPARLREAARLDGVFPRMRG